MKNFRSAIQFLTVLPAGRAAKFDAPGIVPWFPLVGLLLGGLLALFDSFAARWWSPSAVAVLDVVLLAGMTGAFHRDGLGDTADGLFSHRPREKTLEIMKDSRIDETKATVFKRRNPTDSEIILSDFNNYTAYQLYNKIRVLQDPYPNAFVRCKDHTILLLKNADVRDG